MRRRAGGAGRRGRARRGGGGHPVSCTPTAIPRTSSALRRSFWRESHPDFRHGSHELSQEYREFERTSTAAANAYVGPRVRRYLGEMGDHLDAAGFGGEFLIVQSTGGLFGVDEAQSACIKMLESGPAAGVIGTKALCDGIGLENAIAFDMGGTTAKAGVIHDGAGADDRQHADRRLCHRAAGADPDDRHPGGRHRRRLDRARRDRRRAACRAGKRGRAAPARSATGRAARSRPSPTPISFSGGWPPTASSAARCGSTSRRQARARQRVAGPLGLDLTAAADGILRIATTKMSHMVRWVTTERGLDAADFTLVAYGGAGPLHAAMVARELRIAKVVIPRAPGHFSAYGMLVADLRRDFVKTWFTPLVDASFAAMEAIYAEMEQRGRAAVRRSEVAVAGVAVQRAADMRYVGQEHAVTVELAGRAVRGRGPRCHQAALRRRARAALRLFRRRPRRPRSSACAAPSPGSCASPGSSPSPRAAPSRRRDALRGTRAVYFAEAGRRVDTPTYDRGALLARNRIAGPALIEEYASTTVVHPGDVVDGRCLRRPGDRDPAELTMDAAL